MRIILLPLLLLAVFFSGCESVTSRVTERFQPPRPQVHTYAIDQRTVFNAAVAAMHTLDFAVSRARPAQGLLAAHSRVQPGNAYGELRQYEFEVAVTLNDAGKVEVSAVLRQQDETDQFAGATNIPVRQHGLYDSFFAALEMELRRTGALPPAT